MTDLDQRVYEELLSFLKEKGITNAKVFPVTGRHSLRLRLLHALFGCRPIPLMEGSMETGLVATTGRICPICEREFPIDG
jgi:hypothetical protein